MIYGAKLNGWGMRLDFHEVVVLSKDFLICLLVKHKYDNYNII